MVKIKMTKKSTITFQEGYKEFLTYCKVRNLREATIKHYYDSLKTIYKFIEPNTPLNDITRDTVNNFILNCKENLNIKDTTLVTYLRALKTILYYFMELGYVEKFKIPIPRADKEPIEVYTEEELNILLKKNDTDSFAEFRNWCIINFLLGTGCRVNSLVNIKNKDVDFDNATVYLNVTKNRKPLVIPLSKHLIKILREYMSIRAGEIEDYLFCTDFGNKINSNTLSHQLAMYNRKRGVMKTGIHRYRHTFAKNWILNGGDIFRLQKILGHSTMDIVRNYVNMFDEDIKKDFNTFNPLENILTKNNKTNIKLK
ncbi:tyrosine-type recombinase/integrase [Clostridium cadaveris]|uniref:tyrosine-type recombinase/integrase n=1 Tax=Clostridium cadaveris TaxID=1529 RepID=UPI0031D626A2